ncbi:L-aspartate oxidase [Roseiarcus sp.]|uniref:L-aspartate oxidase n=1 Tax=Roseiarcus sp. TaxID=1969460 RepID=UPI003F94D3B7
MTAEPLALGARIVVIGAGVAGLTTALMLAPRPVVVLSKAPLGAEGSSLMAQGGMAAALGPDDAPALHAADTVAAGDGLCDMGVVALFTRAAPAAIETLARLGARFDRACDGAFALGLEAAHARRRIVHAGGDGAGREIMRALVAAARATPSITVLEGVEARRLVVEDRVRGVVAVGPSGPVLLPAAAVVIATGGIGGLYADSTNPPGSIGQGLMLAARAGAEFADLEFVQFHPTALDVPVRPTPLVSEAVRGEGAILVDETGRRFMADVPGAELAPRDVVARAVAAERAAGRRTFLDARAGVGVRFPERFPAIAAACRAAGVDPAREPIPIRPAQHYHMGGIAVDAEGLSSVAGLWACGEAASTGLHGANRLASNSLTEAAVFGAIVARSIASAPLGAPARVRPANAPLRADPASVRPILARAAGVNRDGATLAAAVGPLGALAASGSPAADPASVALMIAVAALKREHSLGAHSRIDFPERPATPRRLRLTLGEAFAEAAALAPEIRARRA